MGDSDYRYEYSSKTYADEILAVIEHAGLGCGYAGGRTQLRRLHGGKSRQSLP